MKKKPTYEELKKELQKLKDKNRTLSRENEKLKYDKAKSTVSLEQFDLESECSDNELLSEQYLFNVLMEMIPGRMYFKNRESQFMKISKSLAKWHGLDNPEVVIGKTDFNLFTKEHAQKAYRDEQQVMKSGISLKNIEEKETLKNGEITWSSTTKMPIIDKNGKSLGIFGISRDITDLKQTQKALKESEEKARIALNTTIDSILLCSPEGVVYDCNATFCQIMKLSKDEIIGQNHLKWFSPEVQKFKAQKLKTVYETKQSLELIDEGHETIFQTILSPIIDTNGNVSQIAIYARDITVKLKAERTLKESEEKLRNILENSNNLFYSHTTKHVLTYMSPQVINILGYTPKETMVKWTELASDNPINVKGYQHTQKAIDTGIVQTPFELELLHKNGKKVWVEVREGPVVENGKTISIVGALIDITDRKKVEQALEDNESYKDALFHRSNIPMVVMDIDTYRYIDCNEAAIKIFGYKSKEEVLGKTPIDVSTQKQYNGKLSLSAAKDKINSALINGSVLFEWQHQRPNKDVWDAEVHLMSIVHKGKKLLKFSLLDITNRKKAEQALIESEASLKESNRTKDKFFSIIAHDLRSPFNTMLGFAKLLVNKFDSFEVKKQKEFLGIITKDIENTHKLLENLFLWARTQRGTIDFYPEKENLYLLTGETVDLFRQSAADKAIIIINQMPEDIYVNADKNMLLTILRNLISNAIKFTQKDGKVLINARFNVDENGQNYVEISVKDTGVGMANEKKVQLFKISENISTKGTEGETGTGLGLILCKEFVEKHGGKIWVESEVWKGSTFIFTLKSE